ncbi:metal ABC transporter permease [Undibacterium macrobrachii]|nr:metal ABC transporter permease [Undibacterium macrobrachii]
MMEWWFLVPILALAFGVMALAPLGVQVLSRGVVFIDLALAQAAAAAALWVSVVMHDSNAVTTQIFAALGALLCAGLVAGMAKRWPAQREALIGLVYVAGASLSLLGARIDAHGRERMAELLAADMLWASWPQVASLAACAVVLGLVLLLAQSSLKKDLIFYPLFAVIASMAVPILGLFVVFASLISPALWVHRGLSLSLAIAVTIVAAGLGLSASWYFDAPSGACVALALAMFGAASALRPQASRLGT